MKLSKDSIAVCLIIFLNILMKGFHLGTAPYGIATEELKMFSSLPLHSFFYVVCARVLAAFVSTLIPLLFFFGTKRVSKNTLEAFAVALALTISPWIFILSRFFNPYIFILLFEAAVFFFIKNRKYAIIGYLAVPLIVFIRSLFSFSVTYRDADIVGNLLQMFDTRTLFFSGDYASFYLRIPNTGFFMFVDILPLIFGIYYCFTSSDWKKYRYFIVSLFLSGLIYFLATPQSLPTIRANILLLSLTFVIGLGYYYIFTALKRYRAALMLVLLMFIANILFFQELFFHHFDNKNSTEWGYAKLQTINYIKNHPDIKSIYITRRLGDLEPYFVFLDPSYRRQYVEDDKIKAVCSVAVRNCLVKEDQLPLFNRSKEQTRQAFDSYGGLPELFLL